MSILSKKEVDELLQQTKVNPLTKEIIFGKEIELLKSGEGIKVNIEDFKKLLKTPIPTYYSSKYKAKKNDIIVVKKISKEDYLIIKK